MSAYPLTVNTAVVLLFILALTMIMLVMFSGDRISGWKRYVAVTSFATLGVGVVARAAFLVRGIRESDRLIRNMRKAEGFSDKGKESVDRCEHTGRKE